MHLNTRNSVSDDLSDKLNFTRDATLLVLEKSELKKLDMILDFLKENYSVYNDIYKFSKSSWGENKLLYLYFSEYLRKNSFSSIQSNTGEIGYAWKHRIAPKGMSMVSLMDEYSRQLQADQRTSAQYKYSMRRLKLLSNFALSIKNIFLIVIG